MSLDTSIELSVRSVLRKTLELDVAQDPLIFTRTITLTDGVGEDQSDQNFHDKRTLAASASEELDVNGSLSDTFGDTVTLARVKVLYLRNLSDGDSLLVGGAAANALGLFSDSSDILKLRPGGILLITASDLTSIPIGSNDKLKLEHSGDTTSSLQYEIVLIGASQ